MCNQQKITGGYRATPPNLPINVITINSPSDDPPSSSSDTMHASLPLHKAAASSTMDASTPRNVLAAGVARRRVRTAAAADASHFGIPSEDEELSSSELTTETPPATAPLSLASIDELSPDVATCDACPHCDDVCSDPFCHDCSVKKKRGGGDSTSKTSAAVSKAEQLAESKGNNKSMKLSNGEATYTMCQLRRHNHTESAWLLCDGIIYDATPFLNTHPGGHMSMLRRSGGVADCSEDMKMHSKKAVKMWKGSRVGKLCRCPGEQMEGSGQGTCKKGEEKKIECVIS